MGSFTGDFAVGEVDDPVTAVSVAWGDGTTTAGSFKQTGGGEVSPGESTEILSVSASHTYAKAGRYRIRVFDSSDPSNPMLVIDDTAVVAPG